MEILVLWIILTPLVGVMASKKNRSILGYMLISVLLSPLVAFIALLVVGENTQKMQSKKLKSGEMKQCLDCAELIKFEARKCRYCGAEQEAVKA